MPRCLIACLILLALPPAFAGPAAPAETAPEKVRMLVEGTSPPFSFRDDKDRPAGFVIELVDAMGDDQGLVVEYDLRPWQVIYQEFLEGNGDILGLVARSDERAQRMDFSVPFEVMRCTFYVRTTAGGPSIRDAAQLAGKRIGVIKDSIVDEFAHRQDWQAQLIRYPSLADCLTATQKGEIDATLSMQFVTDYMIRSHNLDGLVRAEFVPPGLSYSLAFAVHPGRKQLLARLNEGLANMHRNGVYDRLYEKWLGPLKPRTLHWADVQYYLLPLAFLIAVALGGLLWQRKLLLQLSRQAESIRENEERLRLVFEGSQDAFWDWDVRTGRVLRSPRWASMLGYTVEEIGLQPDAFLDLVHPDDRAGVLAHDQSIWHGRDHFVRELRMKARSGEWKWILDRGKVVARDPATAAPLRVTGTHTDITDRKQAEAEAEKLQHKMLETQKLESLGVLAGGIAHDFNNLLTVMLGNTSLARLETADGTDNAARLDSVLTAANRAAELCRQLLAYAGKGSYSIARLNLNELVTETTQLLELSISKQARLEFNLASTLPKIEADPTQVRQIVMNLVMNAAEAIDSNPGVIRIATSLVRLPLPGVDSTPAMTELVPGDYVCVEIADTGGGMAPEVLAKIFDPFFTTKFTGRGLGLAAVIGIIRTHQGTLQVESTPGQGSVFRVYLPVSAQQTEHPFSAPAQTPPAPA